MRNVILNKTLIDEFAGSLGYRTFAYAYKDINSDYWESLQANYSNFVNEEDRTVVETDLIFVAGFGLEDSLRPKVYDSISMLKMSNVTVRMISGDNLQTATRAAVKAGIIQEKDRNNDEVCTTGEHLMELLEGSPIKTIINDKEVFSYPAEMKERILSDIQSKIRVLARCTPEHKFAFIVALQTVGFSVAVTADGLNDVAALKQADVGFCMGMGGCEVAKDASDIIFLDDNFNSVFKATLWGRNILDNIRKFIQFQLPINIVCVFIVFLGGATLGNSPFSVIQLLWLNLIMDTLAAISLATEPPSRNPEDWAQAKKRSKDEKIILPYMWRNILVQVAYQLLILIIMLYSVPYWFGIGYDYVNTDFYESDVIDNLQTPDVYSDSDKMKMHFTIMFHTFVLMNLFNQIASRKLGWAEIRFHRSLFNNKWFLFVIAAEFGLQWCIVEYFGGIFRTHPLEWTMHIACFSFGIGALLVNIGAKLAMKNKEESLEKHFDFNFNENNDASQYNKVLNLAGGLSSGYQRSETMKLLDSDSSTI